MQTEAVMRKLWQRMTEIYGHRWISAYGADAGSGAGETWAKGLSGLDPRDIGAGLEAAILSADGWPPTLPEFRALCLDLPDVAEILLELGEGHAPSSEFGQMVFERISCRRYANCTLRELERMIRDAYRLARADVVRESVHAQNPQIAHEAQRLG